MYNETVLDHFANPRNVGEIENADGIGYSGNPIDGDKITIYIKIRNNILVDVRFKTFGCGAAIAASSMLTVLALGKTIDEALQITNAAVSDELGGLPPRKLLCSNIAADALHAAINNFKENNGSASEEIPSNSIASFAVSEQSEVNKSSDLKADQIQRYLRHIIIPEIGGIGQQKLLRARMMICASDYADCEMLLFYLNALGIGQIFLFVENPELNSDSIEIIQDLNPQAAINIVKTLNLDVDYRIYIGGENFISRIYEISKNSPQLDNRPVLLALTKSWQGLLSHCYDSKDVEQFILSCNSKVSSLKNRDTFNELESDPGISLSNSFAGAFLAIELAKVVLQIGQALESSFYFNLWSMDFQSDFFESNLSFKEIDFLPCQSINALATAKVLTIGAGGLGCPANLTLAKAGVKNLSLIDYDHVEISNLNRQILHSTSKIGMLKVESAKTTLKSLFSDLEVNIFKMAFTNEVAQEIIKNHTLVIDGLDNLPTRYLLNDACYFEKKPLVEAGALSFYGQITTIIPDQGPCFRCLFPDSATLKSGSCSETGVLGPVPGLIGILQAVEAIKIIIGAAPSLQGKLLMIDTLERSFDLFNFKKDNDCPLCGARPTIHDLQENNFVCTEESKQ